jgi:hypothetical protein
MVTARLMKWNLQGFRMRTVFVLVSIGHEGITNKRSESCSMYPLATVLLASPPSRASFAKPTELPTLFMMTCNSWVKASLLLPDETTSPKTQSRTI